MFLTEPAGTSFAKGAPACLLLFLGLLLALAPQAQGFREPEHQRPPDFDSRKAAALARPQPLPPDRAAAMQRLKERLPGARIHIDETLQTPRFIAAEAGFLTGPNGEGRAVAPGFARALGPGDPHRAIKAFLNEHAALFGHGAEILSSARKTHDYADRHNGLRSVIWEQHLDEISIFEAVLMGHISKKGELVNLSSLLVPDAAQAADAGTPNRALLQRRPAVSARQALLRALKSLGKEAAEDEVTVIGAADGAEQRQRLESKPLRKAAEMRLVWLPMNRTALRLCWEAVLTDPVHGETFRALVDVRTGELLLRRCLTVYLSDASFRVYTSDSPSPFSPGHFAPLTNQPPLIARTLAVTNAANTNASPNGWIDDGVNETRGNNVDAHLDRDANDAPDLPRPQGSPFRVFDFPMDPAQSPTSYGDAAVTQLFYWCNWMHDRLWELGFTEEAGNYQNDNFGRGGLGNDAVQADAQDGSGLNNANFTPAPDGSPPRVQMYVFSGPTPRRDGDFDAEVVLHECTHGLSSRLVGGGVGISLSQAAGMGEGWSDWYAITLLSEPGDDLSGNYAMGAYATYRIFGLMQNYYSGIRRYPYSTNLSKNPLTFKDIDPSQASSHIGIPISPVFASGTADEVHHQGEVWCVTLWEARARLIGKCGFSVGNQLILQLVTDGLKLTPPNPTFLEARDAILQADEVLTGGTNRNELWAAFAKRGMGFNASAPDRSTTFGVQESFDLPDDLRVSPSVNFVASGDLGGPLTPSAAIYTITNAGTVTLTWGAQSGNLVTLSPTAGTLAPGGPVETVTASLSTAARYLPAGVYRDTLVFSNDSSGAIQTRAVTLAIGQPDYFTEVFARGGNDLGFETLTFTPDGSASFYNACRTVAAAFPTDPAGGALLSLDDDSFTEVVFSGGAVVSLYGLNYGSVFVGANGFLTFTGGDSAYTESTRVHFSTPRVSALFRDLNPGVGGAISWKQLADRIAVTWQNVPEYGTENANSFQIEMFFDGTIRMTHLGIASNYGLAGLSKGGGEPPGFINSDLSAYGPCVPPLALTLPQNISESFSLLPILGQVHIPQPLGSDLLVSLSSSDSSQASVAPTAIIPAGQTNGAFDLHVFDNALLDGARLIRITASAPGFRDARDFLFVNDNETATLSITLPATAREGDGLLKGAGLVTVSTPPDRSVVVYLSSSNTNKISAPAPVIIPAGQTSAVFDVSIVDDALLDGPQAAIVTAHVGNWVDGGATMGILDNEIPPPVSISMVTNHMIISWPLPYPGFSVEVATNLGPVIGWSALTNQAEAVGGRFTVILEPTDDQRFFRLKKP